MFKNIINIFFILLALFSTIFGGNGKKYSSKIELVYREMKSKKYKRPPDKILDRIAKYNHLIKYFSSLCYTREGYNVNLNYIKALIAAESAGSPTAVSHKGAIGLTQIMYSSAKKYVAQLAKSGFDFKYIDEQKLKKFKKEYLYDPAINILICTYITDLNNGRFGGDLATTVAAWNAGQYAVYKYEGVPPYNETLGLITKVSNYLAFFQSR